MTSGDVSAKTATRSPGSIPFAREAARVGRGEPVEIREGPRPAFEHDRRLLRMAFQRREETLGVAHTEPEPRNSSARRGFRESSCTEPDNVTRPVSRTQARSASFRA